MSALKLLSRFLAWRWMPFFALTGGSLAFVGLVVLIVPTNLGGHALPAPDVVEPTFPQARGGALTAVDNDAVDNVSARRAPSTRTSALARRRDPSTFSGRLQGRVSPMADPAPAEAPPRMEPPPAPAAAPPIARHLPFNARLFRAQREEQSENNAASNDAPPGQNVAPQ
jgi:hypothetical protein